MRPPAITITMGNSIIASLLPLLYLASPGLPIGAFAWSQGLAGAIEQGSVTSAESLEAWLNGIMRFGLARFDLPLLLRCREAAAGRDLAALTQWNAEVLAGRETAELWAEESRLGAALWRILRDQGCLPEWVCHATPPGHICAFAAATVFLGAVEDLDGGGEDAARAFAWSWLENQVAAATKAMPLGQTAAAGVLLRLMPRVDAAVAEAMQIADDEIGASLQGQVMASIAHESQYSRLFRS